MALIAVPNPPEPGQSQFAGETARFVVRQAEFNRPVLSIPNGDEFIWPLGIEGFTLSGSAALGIHKYLGDNNVVVQVTHRSESRIQLDGAFPGATSHYHMDALLRVLEGEAPFDIKILSLPGLMPSQQRVTAESWNFSHTRDNQLDDIEYQISLVKQGVGSSIEDNITIQPEISSVVFGPNRGKSGRYFTTSDNARTLRRIAQIVYGDHNLWESLFSLNQDVLQLMAIPFHEMPTAPLPIGIRISY